MAPRILAEQQLPGAVRIGCAEFFERRQAMLADAEQLRRLGNLPQVDPGFLQLRVSVLWDNVDGTRVANMPRMATTTMISIRVKPAGPRRRNR